MKAELVRKADEVSAILKQLAHPDRLKLLCSLVEKERTVGELVEYVGASQSWISQCLARMKLEGLVDARKDGNFVYYRIADRRLSALMREIYEIYCGSKAAKGV